MIGKNIKTFMFIVSILLPCIVVLIILVFKEISEEKMHAQSGRMKGIFGEVRTLCFGRFLVDIPSQASVVYGPASVESDIWFVKNGSKDLDKIISSRLAEIGKETSYLPKYETDELPMVGKMLDGARSGQKILYGAVNSVGYVIDSFLPIEENLFVQKFGPVPPEIDYISRINLISGRIHPRQEHEVPSANGICIEGGFVELEPVRERVTIGLRFNEFPDIRLSIDAHKNQGRLPVGSSPTKLREEAKSAAEALGLGNFFTRIKVFRNGRRQVGVWEGEELATRRPAYKDDTDAHEFRFHSIGATNDAFHPELDIRLDSGVRGNSKAKITPSITDEEALELWDKIISTIRVRQLSDATPSKEAKPKNPLGITGKSGEICPQTGLWECTDKRRVDGGRRRIFKEGEKIPPVIVTGHIGFLRTLIGDAHRVAQVEWKLTAYETTPSVSGDLNDNPQQDNPEKDTHA